MVRREFTGMLPGAIEKFEELLNVAQDLDPKVAKGYDVSAGKDSFYSWGVACQIQCKDMEALRAIAEDLSILWLSDVGDMAYTNGLSIDDFQTFRVNGNLEWMPEEEVIS